MTARLTGDELLAKMYNKGSNIYAGCGACGKPNQPTNLKCERCGELAPPCSLCHLPIHGVYTWCQECGHGGHTECMEAWFKEESQCPAGCGHQCCGNY